MPLSRNLQKYFVEAGKELPKAYKIQFPIQMLQSGRESFDDGFKRPTSTYEPNPSVERAYSVVGCCHLDGDNMQIV